MRRGKNLIIAVIMAGLAVVLCILAACSMGRAGERRGVPVASSAAGNRVILLVVDRLSYPDLRRLAGPVLSALLEEGAVALMNVRAGRLGSESGYLSLGSGARAVAGPEGGSAYNRAEPAGDYPAETLFKLHTGLAPRGEVLHLHAAALQEKNDALDYPVTVGLLGSLLAEEGLTAAVAGNADAGGPGRGAVMIAMDRNGEVPLGEVGGGTLVEDPLSPYGIRTDPAVLAGAVRAYLGRAHLVVAEFGDLSRLDQYWPALSPARREELAAAAMVRLDEVLGELASLAGADTALLMVTPSPPQNLPGSGEQLVPFLLLAPGGAPGLAASATTRRPGLVTNTDLVPLVMALLKGAGGAAAQATGVVPAGDAPARLDRLAETAALVFRLRPPLVKGYILALIVCLLAGLAGLALKAAPVLRLLPLLEGIMLVPLLLLLLPGVTRFPHPSTFRTGAILVLAVLAAVLVLQPVKKKKRHLFWAVLGLATALALVADTLAGAPLQQVSFLSYDPVAGARFYGIGNEYMGVLVGSSILGTVALAALLEKDPPAPAPRRRGFALFPRAGSALFYAAVLLFYGLIIFLLASPHFGANLGGTVTAAVAFGVAWAALCGALERWPLLVLSVCAFLLLAMLLLWGLNLWWQPELPSHLGHFGSMVRARGLEGLSETVLRKINMNWRLIRYSIWSRAFATLLGLLVVLAFYPTGLLRRLKREQPYLAAGAIAALAGSAAALASNDSGIVAAATLLLYAVPPVLIPIMEQALRVKKQPVL